MQKVHIVTDSTADIPTTLVKKYNIHVVPLTVIFSKDETYADGVELTSSQFYKKLQESDRIPTTSQPAPLQFEKVYERLLKEDKQIISIHLSSLLSGTYQSAKIAKQSLQLQNNIHIIDSKRASYAVGMIVVEIAKMAQKGIDLYTCLRRLNELLLHTDVFFIVDTLTYLQKNGRIGQAAALLGSLLNIKPILSLTKEGEVFPFERVRGKNRALRRLLYILQERYADNPVHIGISHAVSKQVALELKDRLKNKFNVKSITLTTVGAVIGAHVGPGTISISMCHAT